MEKLNVRQKGRTGVRRGLRVACTFAFGREKCLSCGRETFDMPLCRSCTEKYMLSFEGPGNGRCSCCGKVLLSESGTCTVCRKNRVIKSADSVFPLHSYRLWHKKLLSEWKLHGRRSLSPLFASITADALCRLNLSPGNSYIVPVPPRPGKIRREGWDQIMELSGLLHSDYGYAVLPLLKRTSVTQQKEKNRRQRMEGEMRSYSAADGAGDMLSGRGIGDMDAVLIDDVITTGATVEECSARLKELGVRKVHVLSIFIVD